MVTWLLLVNEFQGSHLVVYWMMTFRVYSGDVAERSFSYV